MAIEQDLLRGVAAPPLAAGDSAVSWSAIFAGAAAAGGATLLLFLLGAGLGLSVLEPRENGGIGFGALGWSTVAWIGITQLIASAAGGYIAGRLRSKWDGLAADEVHFRDTAHGFLSWAVATLAMVTLTGASLLSAVGGSNGLATATGGFIAGAATVGATAGPRAVGAGGSESLSFVAATLLGDERSSANAAEDEAPSSDLVAKVGAVLARAMQSGQLSDEETRYLGGLVAQRNGISQAEGETRVKQAFAQLQAVGGDVQGSVKAATDRARKASAFTTLWLLVALLCGAFVASGAALFGGRHRIE
ncbi:hypothetical protein [Solimonas soli]|uniref:hypothetical protein n=1 Tax=Solimonas soli TaxID=413479 RepID=UPI0004B55AA8|nr:hypothetical protein [Solimonas soli]